MEIDIFFYIFLGVFTSFLISFPIIKLLYKFNIVRHIDKDFSAIIEARRLKRGTPIMGGLIVIIAVILLNLIFNFDGTTKIPLLVFSISALLGAFDDILNIYGNPRKVRSFYRTYKLAKVHKSYLMRIYYLISLPWSAYRWFFFLLGSNPGKGIQSHEKILVQTLAGGFVAWWIYWGTGWVDPSQIWVPFIGALNLGILIIPLIIFSVIFMTNAVNITDGMDGLSAGLLLMSFVGYGYVAYEDGEFSIAKLCATVIGSLMVYLYFNIPPARFQMGDVGSLALGTLLATVAFAINRAFLLPIIGLPFVVELLSSVIQGFSRRIFGKRLFRMAPLHHHFEMKGWNESKVVMRAWVIAPVFIIIAIWLTRF